MYGQKGSDMEKATDFILQEQTKRDELSCCWSSMINRLVHDLSNSVVNVTAAGDFLTEILPHLIKGYRLALEHNLMEPEIPEKILRHAKAHPNFCLDEISKEMLDLLSILRPYNNNLLLKEKMQIFSAKNVITEFLENYAFKNSKDEELIKTDLAYDFQLIINKFFIDQFLYRILDIIYETKINFDEIEKQPVSELHRISFRLLEDDNYNIILIKDSQPMSENKITTLLNSFFVLREGKILPDIGYCRLALLQLGGDLIFNSSDNKFVEFSLKFPKSSA